MKINLIKKPRSVSAGGILNPLEARNRSVAKRTKKQVAMGLLLLLVRRKMKNPNHIAFVTNADHI